MTDEDDDDDDVEQEEDDDNDDDDGECNAEGKGAVFDRREVVTIACRLVLSCSMQLMRALSDNRHVSNATRSVSKLLVRAWR